MTGTKIKKIKEIQDLENLTVGDVIEIGYVFPEDNSYSDKELRVFEGILQGDLTQFGIRKWYSFVNIKPNLDECRMNIESLQCLESSLEIKNGIVYVNDVNCNHVIYEAGSYKHRLARQLLQSAGQWKLMKDYKKEARK